MVKLEKIKKDGQFWKRVVEYFNQHNEIGSVRSLDQAKSRWHRCSGDLNEFNEIYTRIHNEYHSGWSDDQLNEATIAEWNSIKKRHFNYMHIWSIINEHAKWNSVKEGEEHSGSKRSSSSMDEESSVARPMGTKAAKARKKNKDKVERDQFAENFSMYKEIQQERIKAIKELNESLKNRTMAQDLALLNADTSNYTEEAKAVHRKMCAEIKAKWNI